MVMVKCPVCEHCEVDTDTAQYKLEHGGRTYFFCEAACQTKFLDDPEKYEAHRPTSA